MAPRKKQATLPEISQAELTVLRPLWRGDALSVRDVHDQVVGQTGWAYTTTKTVMDRMVGKGLLSRDSRKNSFVYTPEITKPAGLARMVQFFADRILETDSLAVVNMFKGTGTLSSDELDELSRLVEDGLEEEK
ncbi:MAG: BlaI/MecI/CopY family transcriptional regulator [Sphingomonadales bacterium]|jgi:predicted transcriptional regulator